LKHPGEPWLGDYPWNTTIVGDDRLHRAWTYVKGALITDLCWFIPTILLTMGFPRVRMVVFVLALIPVGFLLLVVLQWMWARFYRRGTVLLKLHTTPFFLGQEFKATLILRSFPQGQGNIEAILRCKSDAEVNYPSGADSSSSAVACFALYEEFQIASTTAAGDGTATAEIRVPLPADAGVTTRLSPVPTVYWELEVNSKGPDVPRLSPTFLVPVYEQPKGDVRD
jgi:hypothetical protein